MVTRLGTAKDKVRSLLRRWRSFLLRHQKRLKRMVRGLAFHLLVAIPLERLLVWAGVPEFAALVIAVCVSLLLESAVTGKSGQE